MRRQGGDIPAGFADYEYILPMRGDGSLRLDIEGELRTPALLQFLARIGGEFETVGIPHRSFMPELAQTITEDAL